MLLADNVLISVEKSGIKKRSTLLKKTCESENLMGSAVFDIQTVIGVSM